jgi:sigma-B regulation protein RsbU (phosphoserine phosphatase)
VALAGSGRPAQLVGGDGLDYHVHASGLELVVADVSGHGLAAGLLMSSYLGMMRTLELAPRTPAELAAIANRRICREVGLSGQYITACHARLSPDRRTLTYAAMGHPAPLLWRGDVVMPMPAAPGLPAGMADDGRYGEVSVALAPGDVVVFYTDGLVEARSREGAMFGLEGLSAAVAGAPRQAQAVLETLFAACAAFAGAESPLDDQTAIVLHIQDQE